MRVKRRKFNETNGHRLQENAFNLIKVKIILINKIGPE